MKIAIMSDVHANPKAFRKALDDAKSQGCGKIYLLGDVVGYGYDPNACIDMARTECDGVIMGNHDAGVVHALADDWFANHSFRAIVKHREKIKDKARLDWLKGLPYILSDRENGFVAVHGSLDDPKSFNYADCSSSYCGSEILFMKRQFPKCNIEFCGHTHYAFLVKMPATRDMPSLDDRPARTVLSGGRCDIYWGGDCDGGPMSIGDNCAVVNIGSVGFPRNLGKSAYVIYDTDKRTVEFRWLPFDFDEYVRDLQEAGMDVPSWIGRWR